MTEGERLLLVIQVVSTAFIALTFILYFFELRTLRAQLDEAKRSTTAQSLLSLINFLQVEHVREARELVITTLRNRPYKDWDAEQKRAASKVCSCYDVAAILIRMDLVPLEPIVDNWGPSIVLCYEILRPLIEEMQKPENAGPTYWDDYVWLYEQSLPKVKNGDPDPII
jgi:hypothetical protein